MTATRRIRIQQIFREAEGYLELAMPEQALHVLARIDDPGTFRAQLLYLRGEALRTLERYDEAVAQLEEAADLAPSSVPIRVALAWCQKRMGRVDLAAMTLEQALEVEPNNALLHYNLACYYSLLRIKSAALQHLSRALDLNSRYRDAVHHEPDFDSLRADPDFQALLTIIV
jgi:tetratricopeptide (TPR) repeat protein